MRYWRRWRRGWRRKGRKRWWRPRRWNRRKRVRRKRRFGRRRKNKKIVTFWQPPNKVSCKITGWTVGIAAQGTGQGGAADAPMRVYRTFIDSSGASTIQYEGGGVNAIIFSLQFLWEEYRLWHNTWSRTNDGHDLARYFGTTIYLQPHRYSDYIFWWDRDWQKYTNEHFLRCHPVNLFSWKTKVFIRSQSWGHVTKTRKVKIKPPATLTNQWRHMKDWYYTPLFAWGLSLVDWNKFFSRGKQQPYCPLPSTEIRIASIAPEGQLRWTQPGMNLYYNSYYDSGEGNRLWTALTTKAQSQSENPSTQQDFWKPVDWADDLPYWMVFYGQNKTWDMGNYPISEWTQSHDLDENGNRTIWFRIKYPQYTSIDNANTQSSDSRNTYIAWKLQTSAYKFTTNFKLTINLGIAYTGPFVASIYTDLIEIPIMYKSSWQWGGQTWSNMEIINPQHFSKGAVTVKNPYTVARSIIYPGDTGASGLLTDEALARLVQPSTRVEERRPQPWAGLRADEAYQPDYSETGSEAEESEEESDGECDERKTLKTLARRLQREQFKRRQLFTFFKSLLNAKKLQERGGHSPSLPCWG
nr:MAG: ORF1 [Torque teno felis virus]